MIDHSALIPLPGAGEIGAKEAVPISVIILNFNGRKHLEICLPSLVRLNYPQDKLEIIVVDNASSDDSVSWLKQQFPNVRVVVNSGNLGFAKGINCGARVATSSLLAFLNPDMRVDPDWLLTLLETINSDPNVACAGSVVLNWDGDKIDFAGRPRDALNLCPSSAEDARAILQSADNIPLIFTSGGGMLIRREVFLDLDGFDEDYFLYNEDVDLGWRLWIHGYRILRSTRSLVYHKGGASSKLLPPEHVMYLAQKYALYTVLKNLDDDQLLSVLPGVFWFLVDRSRWFHSARLSLGQAVREVMQEMDILWQKRSVLQVKRVQSDAEIFATCGHPFGFLFENPDYPRFLQYLAENEESPVQAFLSADAISQYMIRLLYHAYKFNYEQLLNHSRGLSKSKAATAGKADLENTADMFLPVTITRITMSILEPPLKWIARRILPRVWRQHLSSLWYRVRP